MTDEPSDNGAATRAAQLRARRADGRKPAASARILTAGISGTAILGMMAVMGATADSDGAPPTTMLSVESPPPVTEPTTAIESAPVADELQTTEATETTEPGAIVAIPPPTPVPPTQPPAPTRPLAITRQSG
jgi:hypothetical protein